MCEPLKTTNEWNNKEPEFSLYVYHSMPLFLSIYCMYIQSRMENHYFPTAECRASVTFEVANKKRIFINLEHVFSYLQYFGLYASYVECCNGSIWFTVIVINGFHVFFISFVCIYFVCIFQSNHLEYCESVCLRFSIYPIYFIFARNLVWISTKFPNSMLPYKLHGSQNKCAYW